MSGEYKYLEVQAADDIFIVTLRNGEDNRLNFATCKELMHAMGVIRDQLGQGQDGALIVRGNNNKFFTNVRFYHFGTQVQVDDFVGVCRELILKKQRNTPRAGQTHFIQ